MAKKRSASSAQDKATKKSAKHTSDKKIDYSDIPASSDKELKKAKRVGRPSTGNAKQLVAIRIDPKLLAKLKKMANKKDLPYQTFIHELLKKASNKAS